MAGKFKGPVRIAIIGASGFIGRAHLHHILEEKDCELAALIDTASSVASTAKEHGVPYFQSTDEFLRQIASKALDLDAVVLATPTQTHVSLAKAFANTGLAMLIEKPLAATSTDGKELLISSIKDKETVYMVGHHRRHSSYVQAIKNVLAKEKLGDILAVNGVWTMRKSDTYFEIPWHTQVGAGGVLLTNAIHDFDVLQYWLGDIVEVSAMEGPKKRVHPVDSTVQAIFKFATGVVGSFLFSDASASHQSWEAGTGDNPTFAHTGADFLSIFGTKGSISVPSMIRYHYGDRPEAEKNWTFPLGKDISAKEMVDDTPAFTHQLKHFIAVTRRKALPNCSTEDALKAVFVIEAVFKSLETGMPCAVEGIDVDSEPA